MDARTLKAKKQAACSKALRARRLAAGLCFRCEKPVTDNHTRCAECLLISSATSKQTRKRRKENGICVDCSSAVADGHIRCEVHLQVINSSVLSLHEGRLKDGLCPRCGKETCVPDRRQCSICFLKSVSVTLWGSRSRWRELLELFEKQDGKCAYSRVPLILGGGASIDHIVPRSRGGTNEIGNLQWVDLIVNRMKSDLMENEFFDLLQCILGNRCNSYSSKA